MKTIDFKSMPSYNIVDHLYDEQKDFIILGLCGRVGSGVSTVASILEKKFEDLQLPKPGFDNPDSYAAHEDRILYTYAKENWKPFYKIRTSALITRHILQFSEEEFSNYLIDLYDQEGSLDHASPELRKIKTHFDKLAKEFFNKPMECDVRAFLKCLQISEEEQSQLVAPWNLFVQDEAKASLIDDAKSSSDTLNQEVITKEISFPIFRKKVEFQFNTKTWICTFSNTTLSTLLEIYATLRREKAGFRNPLFYLVLKQYLYEFLPHEASVLWEKVRKESESLPTQALQCLGNNLRLNKMPYYNSSRKMIPNLLKDGYVSLAEDVNLTIKVLRAYQLIHREVFPTSDDTRLYTPNSINSETRTIIVIDSIKNPYESLYLKARYNNYYLIGIYTEDTERCKRLREKEHFVDEDIRAIDIIEQNTKFKQEIKAYGEWLHDQSEKKPKCETPGIIKKMYEQFNSRGLLEDLSYISPFVLQNVSSCLDSADILINNQPSDKSYAYLKRTLLRYVSLIMNPGIVLPTAVERCMQIANTAKLNSGCISRQVGAVLTDGDYHMLSVGWNQQPEGQIPCSYRDLCELHHHWDSETYSDYENNDNDKFQENITEQVISFFDTTMSPLYKKGKLPRYCFKDYYNSIEGKHNQVHTRALHAEETAFLNLGANKERVNKGILFTTSSPCELCSKKAMFLGVSTIYYIEAYAGVSQKHVLNIGGVKKRPNLILFTGAVGTAYTKLFTPLLPQKDENEMWLGMKMDAKLDERIKEKINKQESNGKE